MTGGFYFALIFINCSCIKLRRLKGTLLLYAKISINSLTTAQKVTLKKSSPMPFDQWNEGINWGWGFELMLSIFRACMCIVHCAVFMCIVQCALCNVHVHLCSSGYIVHRIYIVENRKDFKKVKPVHEPLFTPKTTPHMIKHHTFRDTVLLKSKIYHRIPRDMLLMGDESASKKNYI